MSLLRDLRAAVAEWKAHRLLRRLMDTVGRPGLRAVTAEPGLAAVVDQHAAAVRDIVRDGMRRSGGGSVATLTPPRTSTGGAVRLAAYARLLLDEQRRSGATIALPQRGIWRPTDWTTLRLIAVCQLVSRGGV
ncbi:DUF6401 family natural product biosynthesis protein [Pseudonocardia sp. RS010]|uniref:DUF6401 family natural product biosynthesis protein n=1 Tax=Pseudonocardia sp. RS010 TaxID=3385979 RepID=UPI0039A01401